LEKIGSTRRGPRSCGRPIGFAFAEWLPKWKRHPAALGPADRLLASALRNWRGLNRHGSAGASPYRCAPSVISYLDISQEYGEPPGEPRRFEPVPMSASARVSSIPNPAQNRHSHDILQALDQVEQRQFPSPFPGRTLDSIRSYRPPESVESIGEPWKNLREFRRRFCRKPLWRPCWPIVASSVAISTQ